MGIQITGLRPKPGTTLEQGDFEDYSIFDKYKLEAASIADILDNPKTILDKIPASEHWNLYFTVANCGVKKREFVSQDVIAFDLDGIDNSEHEKYIEVVCKTLAIKPEQTGIVASGNGLHFYVGLQIPIVSKDFFKQNKHHYKALLSTLELALKEANLPIGKCDPAIFDARRILRMPGTINKKPGRADRECKVINAQIIAVPFDLTLASGVPSVSKDEAIPKDFLKKYPKTDNAAIMSGCDFMKFVKQEPGQVTEPQWYAALSIAARMQDGVKLAHELSAGHKGYSFEKTEAKIDHALNASPPRKCSSINQLWGQCRGCPNFEKIESPIMLRSEDAIPTQGTGFHIISTTDKGVMKYTPCYKDLREFFERQNKYVAHSKICWVYNGKHYEAFERALLQNFAQTHFDPYAMTKMTQEFENLVMRTNPVDPQLWDLTTKRKINFQNGVLHLDRMDFLPHSPEYGFKYCLPYEYDPYAKAPVFEKYLIEAMGGDESLTEILKEFGGYALSGDDCKGAKALFLEGEGANGKSTFVKVLKALAGKDNYQTISLRDFSHMERRHGLDGALFNIAEETPDKVADSNDFKNLVDGGELKVRKLFSDDYTIENRAKLIFTCNSLPASFDTSLGYRRRLLIVPFDQNFKDPTKWVEDKNIDDKLYAELPGIFNVMLAAYQRFVKNNKNFTASKRAEKELTEYVESNDPVLQWLEEYMEVLPPAHEQFKDAKHSITELYINFSNYCKEHGHKPHNSRALGKRLRTIFKDDRFTRTEHARHMHGIRMLEVNKYGTTHSF